MNESASIWLVSARSWVSLTPMKSLTCMMTAALLLAFGCSKDDPAAPAAPKNVGGSGGNTAGPGGMGGDGGEITVDGNGGPQTPEGTQRVNEDPNTPPVLAEMAGLYYEVYQIVDKPYTGKVVEYHATNVEKSEKVYEVGRLTSFTEWHENAQKSHEVTYAADGKTTEKRWNKKGEQIGATTSGAPGRGFSWTFGGGQSARRIDGYTNKASDLVKRVFGAPDEEQNGVWIYRSMKITAVQSGQIMTTVRFTMANGQVLSVSVEP